MYLTERPEEDANRRDGEVTQAEIARAFAALARSVKEDDVVFVVLIGHGTFDGQMAKFNLPGPDMTRGGLRAAAARPAVEAASFS